MRPTRNSGFSLPSTESRRSVTRSLTSARLIPTAFFARASHAPTCWRWCKAGTKVRSGSFVGVPRASQDRESNFQRQWRRDAANPPANGSGTPRLAGSVAGYGPEATRGIEALQPLVAWSQARSPRICVSNGLLPANTCCTGRTAPCHATQGGPKYRAN